MSRQQERIFKALGNNTRLNILKVILAKKEISCQKLMNKFTLSQPTMSHHLGLLLDSGILTVRKEGVKHYYQVDVRRLKSLGIDLTRL